MRGALCAGYKQHVGHSALGQACFVSRTGSSIAAKTPIHKFSHRHLNRTQWPNGQHAVPVPCCQAGQHDQPASTSDGHTEQETPGSQLPAIVSEVDSSQQQVPQSKLQRTRWQLASWALGGKHAGTTAMLSFAAAAGGFLGKLGRLVQSCIMDSFSYIILDRFAWKVVGASSVLILPGGHHPSSSVIILAGKS